MAVLTREQILSAQDRAERVTVSVPEWGGDVLIGVFGATQRDTFEQWSSDAKKSAGSVRHFRARFVAMCLLDEKGAPLFTEADVVALGEKSHKALDRVFEAAWKLNGMGKEGVEQAEKNSAPAPAAASS